MKFADGLGTATVPVHHRSDAVKLIREIWPDGEKSFILQSPGEETSLITRVRHERQLAQVLIMRRWWRYLPPFLPSSFSSSASTVFFLLLSSRPLLSSTCLLRLGLLAWWLGCLAGWCTWKWSSRYRVGSGQTKELDHCRSRPAAAGVLL
ncbi:hypothetical protein ElyMa_000707000 [Elysia marginata]|uniref:Uncharacterized protein n=1 Tax=Elysia marginata TaxID=1093978 RepID=A0AAV4GKS6_9GAST|nr:hypothetical protein ElyMa_000707000 [Elysia marginata]